MLMSVPTMALPRAGIVRSFALYRSWPAANALPFVGAFAVALKSRTCSEFSAAVCNDAAGFGCWGAAILASGVGVASPESVLCGRVDVSLSGVGSMTLVRFGSGELGIDGGSWARAGVPVSSRGVVFDMIAC